MTARPIHRYIPEGDCCQTGKAIFLDRDGVINVDYGYVHRPEQFDWVTGMFDFCARAAKAGYSLIVVSNQSGIARGLFTEDQFLDLTQWVHGQFFLRSSPLASTWYCPHHPQFPSDTKSHVCTCRKPDPGMLLAAAEFHQIDVSKSIIIGDKQSDLEAGSSAGVRKGYLLGDVSFEQIAQDLEI